jgi:hypothetical protein
MEAVLSLSAESKEAFTFVISGKKGRIRFRNPWKASKLSLS